MTTKRSVELASLVRRLPASTQASGDLARLVTAVEIDSRRVQPGALFVAIQGEHADGHDFLQQAIAKGALAVVVENGRSPRVASHVTVLHVPDTRRALSALAAAFYGDPSQQMDTIGVTGTNGKTTTTRMIASILDAAGKPCGVIGTVGAEFGERQWPLGNTTPLPPELHGVLAEMRDAGAKAVAMEVSSHALALDRVDDVAFSVAALTNVTRDHLDFHGTLEAYAAAKRRLFSMAHSIVLNLDDEYGERWSSELHGRGVPVTTYALDGNADVVAQNVEVAAGGTLFTIGQRRFELHVPGRFNVSNALAAISVARVLGIDDASAAKGLSELRRVPGRMEHVRGAGVDAIVDYAHTPDALQNALASLRETCTGRLTVVFGCGGDRDRGKRAQMGAVAAKLADRIYVTSDNPRSEEPQAIVDEIVAGIDSNTWTSEVDRRRAIERAISEARSGDVVLVAGKGHEGYQIVGDRVFDFDDVAVVREALRRREAAAT